MKDQGFGKVSLENVTTKVLVFWLLKSFYFLFVIIFDSKV